MTKEIPLTQGRVALVDDEDYEWLSRWKWHLTSKGYAARGGGESEYFKMHRVIMGLDCGDSRQVDRIDHNPLNNQRSNLRICSLAENNRNVKVRSDSISGYKGVQYHKQTLRWRARIQLDGKRRWIGYYKTAEDAARAYDKYAIECHGQFAFLNFPQEYQS